VIFVHGSDGDSSPDSFERIDYGGLVNLLRVRRSAAAGGLMTTFFIAHRDHAYNESGHALAWKRRSKRFLRWLRPPEVRRLWPGPDDKVVSRPA